MKNISVELSKDGIGKLNTYILSIENAIQSQEFVEFIADKAKQTLLEVQNERLSTEDRGSEDEYRRSHRYKIERDRIYLFNHATISQDKMGESYRQFYPNGFDLAKAVEYGVGIVGAGSSGAEQASKDGWQYDVNGHGYKGWFYEDENGNKVWTNGYSGRLIYYNTTERIKTKINSWTKEFLEKKENNL